MWTALWTSYFPQRRSFPSCLTPCRASRSFLTCLCLRPCFKVIAEGSEQAQGSAEVARRHCGREGHLPSGSDFDRRETRFLRPIYYLYGLGKNSC